MGGDRVAGASAAVYGLIARKRSPHTEEEPWEKRPGLFFCVRNTANVRSSVADQCLFACPRESLDRTLTFHGGCAVRLRFDIDELHRPTRPSVARAAARIVDLHTVLSIQRPARIKSTILALDDVTETRLLARGQ